MSISTLIREMTAAGKIKNQFIGREEMIADIYLNDYFYLNTNCVPLAWICIYAGMLKIHNKCMYY